MDVFGWFNKEIFYRILLEIILWGMLILYHITHFMSMFCWVKFPGLAHQQGISIIKFIPGQHQFVDQDRLERVEESGIIDQQVRAIVPAHYQRMLRVFLPVRELASVNKDDGGNILVDSLGEVLPGAISMN